jgi:hypothetical protein
MIPGILSLRKWRFGIGEICLGQAYRSSACRLSGLAVDILQKVSRSYPSSRLGEGLEILNIKQHYNHLLLLINLPRDRKTTVEKDDERPFCASKPRNVPEHHQRRL